MTNTIEVIVSLLLIIGSLFALVGSIGLLRLPDFMCRLHAPAKITTLGIGSLLLASMVYAIEVHGGFSFQEIVIVFFIFISAPISAHMLSKVALHLGLPVIDKTKNKHLLDTANERRPPSR